MVENYGFAAALNNSLHYTTAKPVDKLSRLGAVHKGRPHKIVKN